MPGPFFARRGAGEEGVGLVVADELFGLGIEFQFHVEELRDDTESKDLRERGCDAER